MAGINDVRKFLRAGANRFSFAPYDSDDKLALFGGTSIVNGDQNGNAGTRRVEAVKTVPLGMVPEPETIAWDGDDGYVDSILVENAAPPEGIGLFAEFDLDTEAFLQGSAVKSVGDMATGALLIDKPAYPVLMAIIQGPLAKSLASDSRGLPHTAGYILMNCQMAPMNASAIASRTATDDQYKLTLGKRVFTPWGETIADSYATCEAGVLEFTSEYPIEIQAWKGHGTETVFNLALTPAEASGDKVPVWVQANLQIYGALNDYTVDASAKTITFAVAPAVGDYIVSMYQFASDCN